MVAGLKIKSSKSQQIVLKTLISIKNHQKTIEINHFFNQATICQFAQF
jgi:hypothetical protein